MDELMYLRYQDRAKKADEIQRAVMELYGFGVPWKQSYFMAIKDRLLSKEEKELVKVFHPIR